MDKHVPTTEEVETKAKELYALSDQGEWQDLSQQMQQMWINSTRRELEEKGSA